MIGAIATPAAQTMANATNKIPIVATAVTDFEIAKLVKSNDKPGTNVTGSSDMAPISSLLELIVKIYPNAKNVGVMYSSSEINSERQVQIFKEEAKKHNLNVREATVSNVNDIQQAAQSLVGKVDLIYTPTDNTIASAVPALIKITEKAKLRSSPFFYKMLNKTVNNRFVGVLIFINQYQWILICKYAAKFCVI